MENNGWKSNVEISPNCPRCGSSNTKFCYYNNYSLTQPRYFCKGCRRYWTKGGSLRNVPVGGGCRKHRRGNMNLRQSIDGLTFKNSPPSQDHSPVDSPIGHNNSYDPRRTNIPSSSSSEEGPNIDLALVYANFLNQKSEDSREADQNNSEQIMQTPFDPSLENSTEVVGHGLSTLPQELGLLNLPEQQQPSTESYFSEGTNDQIYFNSMQTLQKDGSDQQCSNNIGAMNFELPPLPGEDEASHDVMWSNSEMMINLPFQVNQPPPLLGADVHDADLLIGNWNPFDYSRDASFSRP